MILAIILSIILFIGGLVVLGLASDYLVTALVSIAKAIRIPLFIMGSFILAIGTAIPELANNVVASLASVSNLGMGNLIGSSTVSISLTLGIVLLLSKETKLKKGDIPTFAFAIVPVALLFLFAFDGYIGRIEGVVLLAIYTLHQILLYRHGAKRAHEYILLRKLALPLLLVPIAIFSIVISAFLTVDTISTVAMVAKIPIAIISLTVVSVGTALPEMISSLSAVRRKQHELAFGNLFGAVAANLMLVLGIIAVVFTMQFNFGYFRLPLAVLLGTLLFFVSYVTVRRQTDKLAGWCLVSAYAFYLVVNLLMVKGVL